MSSVAGWLTTTAKPLTRIEASLSVLRRELHESLHYGELGTQLHVLFEASDPETVARRVGTELESPSRASAHRLGGRTFVELNLLTSTDGSAPGSLPFDDLLHRLGVGDVESTTVLAEQTTATEEDSLPDNMGMSVFGGLALAACGDYGRFLKETDIGHQIEAEGRRRGVPNGEVPNFVAWFLKVLDETGGDWRAVLERTPTYLFSLVLDGRSNDRLELVALRRNTRLGTDPSPFQHLAYCEDEDGVLIARTPSGVAAMVNRDVAPDIRLVPDMTPVRFSL